MSAKSRPLSDRGFRARLVACAQTFNRAPRRVWRMAFSFGDGSTITLTREKRGDWKYDVWPLRSDKL